MQKTMTIHFKDGRTLPGIPMNEHNRLQYEKIMGQDIKEFVPDEPIVKKNGEKVVLPTFKKLENISTTPDEKDKEIEALKKQIEKLSQENSNLRDKTLSDKKDNIIHGKNSSYDELKKQNDQLQKEITELSNSVPLNERSIINHFSWKGKSALSIAKFMGLKKEDVEKILKN